MSTSVFLADLRHTYMGVLSSDAMPLNVGYMKAVMDRDLDAVDSRLFVYPERLLAAIEAAPPDVLMLSNYTWNEQLSLFAAARAKQIKPDMLVVMGGPNIPDEPERQCEFLARHRDVDLYVLGEGDFLAADIVAHFVDAGKDLVRFTARDLPSSVYGVAGEMRRNAVKPRQRALDEIPSPWLNGVMDEFFDGRLAPLWETNRGCPFQCTFCVQGTGYYNKVTYFDVERLREEIHYIGRRVAEKSPSMAMLRIADPNYGMYRRDPVISGYIGEVQAMHGFPTYIDATTGKNRPERIIESMEKVSGALVLYQAVQSLDEGVLKTVNRSNISIEAYEALHVHLRGRGLRSSSDLILGLPGETLETHVGGLLRMIDAGVSKLNNFQCMLLKGTSLERAESRSKYAFESRFRVVPKSFGVYGGDTVFEDEEIVVATQTMSFADYLRARTYHLACAVFLNTGRLDTLFRLAQRHGLARSAVFDALVARMEADDGAVGALVRRFLEETRGELFESREELVEFYRRPDNMTALRDGHIGDNLIYKYSALAALHAWTDVSEVALSTVRTLLDERADARQANGFDTFWTDLGAYQTLRFATGTEPTEVLEPVTENFSFDIPTWIEDDLPADIEPYRFDAPRRLQFQLPPQHARTLHGAVQTYGLQQPGVTMLIKRILPEHLERLAEPVRASVESRTANEAPLNHER